MGQVLGAGKTARQGCSPEACRENFQTGWVCSLPPGRQKGSR